MVGSINGWWLCVSIHILCSLHTDSSNKSGIAHTFHAMALHSPDSAKKVASEILPLVFLAMHAKAKEDGMTLYILILQLFLWSIPSLLHIIYLADL